MNLQGDIDDSKIDELVNMYQSFAICPLFNTESSRIYYYLKYSITDENNTLVQHIRKKHFQVLYSLQRNRLPQTNITI